jgi:hypothetical protein
MEAKELWQHEHERVIVDLDIGDNKHRVQASALCYDEEEGTLDYCVHRRFLDLSHAQGRH